MVLFYHMSHKYIKYCRISLILLLLLAFLSLTLAETFSWAVVGNGYEGVSGLKASCTKEVWSGCVWSCDDECAWCIASGECNRKQVTGSCGTLGTKEECKCYYDYESEPAISSPSCNFCDSAGSTSPATALVERVGLDGPNSGTVTDSLWDLGAFNALPVAQEGGAISDVTYTVSDSSDTVKTYFNDTLTSTTKNPSARVYAEPLAPGLTAGYCPKSWTSQQDFASGTAQNLSTTDMPGHLVLSSNNWQEQSLPSACYQANFQLYMGKLYAYCQGGPVLVYNNSSWSNAFTPFR